MSIETIGWAKLQTCGDGKTKAVLNELANWARPDGICEFRSVPLLAKVTEFSVRAVQRALKKLELSVKDGGLGLIRRVTRKRGDGGQAANCFELIGYIYPGDKLAPGGVTDCHRPPRQPVTGPGANLSPLIKNLDLEIKKPPNPLARGKCASAPIPDDWVLTGIDDLPEAIAGLARQWPTGAYQAEAVAFHQHWRGAGRKKADWGAAWVARVQSRHEAVMRMAKVGISFVGLVSAGAVVARPPVRAKLREDARSAALHAAVREIVGDRNWKVWFQPSALIFEDGGLMIIAPTVFHADTIEESHRQAIDRALITVGTVGTVVEWTRIVAESMGPAGTIAAKQGRKRT